MWNIYPHECGLFPVHLNLKHCSEASGLWEKGRRSVHIYIYIYVIDGGQARRQGSFRSCVSPFKGIMYCNHWSLLLCTLYYNVYFYVLHLITLVTISFSRMVAPRSIALVEAGHGSHGDIYTHEWGAMRGTYTPESPAFMYIFNLYRLYPSYGPIYRDYKLFLPRRTANRDIKISWMCRVWVGLKISTGNLQQFAKLQLHHSGGKARRCRSLVRSNSSRLAVGQGG